jgi:hypothetical protein
MQLPTEDAEKQTDEKPDKMSEPTQSKLLTKNSNTS